MKADDSRVGRAIAREPVRGREGNIEGYVRLFLMDPFMLMRTFYLGKPPGAPRLCAERPHYVTQDSQSPSFKDIWSFRT
jgi:hypothetical protein